MTTPELKRGRIICYNYLWRDDADKGKTKGDKDRPCLVTRIEQSNDGKTTIHVRPFTSEPQRVTGRSVEIPQEQARRIDFRKVHGKNERCWLVADEHNKFTLPSRDIKAPRNDVKEYPYPVGSAAKRAEEIAQKYESREVDRDAIYEQARAREARKQELELEAKQRAAERAEQQQAAAAQEPQEQTQAEAQQRDAQPTQGEAQWEQQPTENRLLTFEELFGKSPENEQDQGLEHEIG